MVVISDFKRKSAEKCASRDSPQPHKRQRVQTEHAQPTASTMKSMLDVDTSIPIVIAGTRFSFTLLMDNAEERNKASVHKIRLFEEFNRSEGVRSEKARLAMGDFCWTLTGASGERWLLPMVVERKRWDDLLHSTKDSRFAEQKWRMKRLLTEAKLVYLVEKRADAVSEERDKKTLAQCLVATELRDRFLVFHTDTLHESVRVLGRWSKLLYSRVRKEARNAVDSEHFLRDMGCVPFDSLNSGVCSKKNVVSAKDLFGRQLMAIPGVTVTVATAITRLFPTMRHLIDAWDA